MSDEWPAPKGSRWDFFNATTGEIRNYEVQRVERSGLVHLRRLGVDGDRVAQVWALTLYRPGNGGSRSYWTRIA